MDTIRILNHYISSLENIKTVPSEDSLHIQLEGVEDMAPVFAQIAEAAYNYAILEDEDIQITTDRKLCTISIFVFESGK